MNNTLISIPNMSNNQKASNISIEHDRENDCSISVRSDLTHFRANITQCWVDINQIQLNFMQHHLKLSNYKFK